MKGTAVLDNPFKRKIVYDSPAINKYLDQMENMRKNTFVGARSKLSLLPEFAKTKYGLTVDDLIEQMKAGKKDRYDVMAAYNNFLKKEKKKAPYATRKRVTGAREFFESHSIEFSDRQFRLKVKFERAIKRSKTATDKEQIIELMQATHEPDLALAELWHAATGRRPEEIFSLRHCDVLIKKPCRICEYCKSGRARDCRRRVFHVRGEFTKMGDEQERPMTAELAARTERFIKWKHRHRRIVSHYKDGSYEVTVVDPVIRPNDLLFAPYRRDATNEVPQVDNVYDTYQGNLAELLDSIGKGERVNPDDPRSPRKFTFYRLRDHVKTTISDLGFGDFGEWYIGHAGSTYYNQPEKKRAEVFAKIAPYLTYLDVSGMEARGADIQSELEQQKEINKKLHEEVLKVKGTQDLLIELLEKDPEFRQKFALAAEKRGQLVSTHSTGDRTT